MTLVYFDGLCPLCSREIDHYRKQPGSDRIRFIDITADDFDARSEGLDPVRVHREMHVRRPDGKLAIGVDAFIAIWDVLPRYRRFAGWARVGWVNRGMRVGYRAFAAVRPYLPRRKRDCAASPYCETKN